MPDKLTLTISASDVFTRGEPALIEIAMEGASTPSMLNWHVEEWPSGRIVRSGVIPESDFHDNIAHAEVRAELPPGTYAMKVAAPLPNGDESPSAMHEFTIQDPPPKRMADNLGRLADNVSDGVDVTVSPDKRGKSEDQALWVAIRNCLDGRSFQRYREFIDRVLCKRNVNLTPAQEDRLKSGDDCSYLHGVNSYNLLEAATEVFLLCHACCSDPSIPEAFEGNEEMRLGHRPETDKLERHLENYMVTGDDLTEFLRQNGSLRVLPYINLIVNNLQLTGNASGQYPFCASSLRYHFCLFELIWSYWHEMGYLVQTLNAITFRFQNRLVGNGNPLVNIALDPLRPINNLLWGYTQTEFNRLTVKRRAYEYSHEYGLRLQGKAVDDMTPADPRSKFLEAFHHLLRHCAEFYKEDANAWITPDPFPLMNSIVAVHLQLAEGAHNQWGDMPSRARQEMMIQQWLLAQPPMREFLQSRAMMPYPEPWMGQVDAMKRLMGWTDVSIIHFNRLAVYGERILLSIRFGHWSDPNIVAQQAANWAIYWRSEIQGYIQAYHTVTGVDLSAGLRRDVHIDAQVDASQPSVLLQRRMAGGMGRSPNGEPVRPALPQTDAV
jgi:hypothetical protein